MRRWFGGWSGSIALLGSLAFCFTLAEGAGLNWFTVYVTESLGGTEAFGAVALGVFLGAVTLGAWLVIGSSLAVAPCGFPGLGPSWPDLVSAERCW